MTTIEELDRRITALETAQKQTAETQEWMAGTLGRIAAVQDRHTATLADHTKRFEGLEAGLRRVEKKVDDLATGLPTMLAEAVREGLKAR